MFNVSKLLVAQPLLQGPRVGILTNAGGPGVLAADAAVGWGLSVPALSEETQRKLSAFLPREAALGNPVDIIASASGEQFEQSLRVMLDDASVDAVLVINIPLRDPEEIAAAIRRVMTDYGGRKPVLACFMMSGVSGLDMRYGDSSMLPVYMFPEDAVQSLALAWPYARYRQRKEGAVPEFGDVNEEAARRFLHTHPSKQGWLAPEAAMGLLRNYGITAADTRAAYSPEEAVEAARAIGMPVAMKLRSMTITHKTDVGGISLNLQNEEAVRNAYGAIRERMEAAGFGDAMEGVIVQPMARGGQEVIIGMSQDPVFGPLLMVGMGGVQVELIKDVAFSLHPLTDNDPDYMLDQLRSLPLLTGWRGAAPKDVRTLKEVLLRFSALVDDFSEIGEMEINPLMVFDEGQGCMVVDARIRMKGPV